MSKNPLVAIIMNCFNSEAFICEAIQSVLRQTYQNWELIIWDNLSKDDTAKVVRSFNDSRIKYYLGKNHVSLGLARNFALEKVNGTLITFLDSDDRWCRDKLELQVSIMLKNGDSGFIYTNYKKIDHNGKFLGFGLSGKQPSGEVFRSFLKFYPVNLQTVMFRKNLLNDLDSWFDAKLDLSEEYDLFMRILYKTNATYLDAPLVDYRFHSNMQSIQKLNMYSEEYEYMLNKFKKLVPNFSASYSQEIKVMNAKLAYYKARTAFFNNDVSLARALLFRYKFFSFKFFGLFFLSALGKRAWIAVHKLFFKYV